MITPAEGSSSQIIQAVEALKNKFIDSLSYGQGTSEDPIFTIQGKDNSKRLIVPKNYTELLENEDWQVLHTLIAKLNIPLILSKDVELKKISSNIDVKTFLLAILNRSEFDPERAQLKKLNIGGINSHKERGITAFDLQVLRVLNTKILGLEKFLPDSTKVGKAELITYYLGQLGGSQGSKILNDLPNILKQVIGQSIKEYEASWRKLSESFLIPFGDSVKDLIKLRKVETGKGSQKKIDLRPIHIERPSSSIYITFDSELQYMKSLEGPWTEIKTLAETYKLGVPLGDLQKVREAYSKAYTAQFEKVSALSTWRSRKEEAYKKIFFDILGKDQKKDKFSISKKLKQELLEALDMDCRTRDGDRSHLADIFNNLNPKHLLGAKDVRNQITYQLLENMIRYKISIDRGNDSFLSVWDSAREQYAEIIPDTVQLLIPEKSVVERYAEVQKSEQAGSDGRPGSSRS